MVFKVQLSIVLLFSLFFDVLSLNMFNKLHI
jgi:hypothetical protein